MRPKQSLTASGMYSRSGPFTPPIAIRAFAHYGDSSVRSGDDRSWPGLGFAQNEGLLHDARNLMGALGLYCDLLAMPGVLKPEHRHYAEDLRLLGTRSGALMEHLMVSSLAQGGPQNLRSDSASEAGAFYSPGLAGTRTAGAEPVVIPVSPVTPERPVSPVSLRKIVERCSGLLSRVAGGRTIEVSYGAAASLPAMVAEEAVERILVNLVRNSAAALGGPELASDTAGAATRDGRTAVREIVADPTSDETPGAIRIGVGLLSNRVGDPKPWPFRRVRLTVEDSGCGMSPEQLERVLCGVRAPSRGSHGIGFRVVRELVVDSQGDLRVMSAPGIGTRVQIEWPVAAMPVIDRTESGREWDGASFVGRRTEPFAALETNAARAPEESIVRETSLMAGAARSVEAGASSGNCGDSVEGAGRWISC